MNRDELIKRAKDPKYISGIHNYCDRWCERCTHTSRCLNYSLVEERFGDLEEKDIFNEEFWERFSELLQETLAMVKEWAEEEGIDLDFIRAETDSESEDLDDVGSPVQLIAHLSENYGMTTHGWFESNEHLFDEKMDELNRLRLVSSKDKQLPDVIGISDAMEVIRWYQFQIHVKLRRAIGGISDENDPDLASFPKDSDGSAKVALIGIDRSLSAWNILLQALPQQEKELVVFIELLDDIRTRTEIQFPNARDFVRPGFDEGPLAIGGWTKTTT